MADCSLEHARIYYREAGAPVPYSDGPCLLAGSSLPAIGDPLACRLHTSRHPQGLLGLIGT